MIEISLPETPLAQLQRELDAARADLAQFTYAVSHDLRAPLRHINAYAQVMAEDWPDMPDEMTAHLGTIRQAAQLMTQQLDGLTQLSRLGLQPLNLQPVNVSALAQQVAAELGSLAGAWVRSPVNASDAASNGATGCAPKDTPEGTPESAPFMATFDAAASPPVIWQLASDVPLVLADAAMLRLVLLQVLGNALKFSRSRHPAIISLAWHTVPAQAPSQAPDWHGNQAIATHETGLSLRAPTHNPYRQNAQVPDRVRDDSPGFQATQAAAQGAACQITVSDNGIGFAPDQAKALFQVFGKLHPAREFEGLGLGLVQCRKMLSRMGASMAICGAVNLGCRVDIILPVA